MARQENPVNNTYDMSDTSFNTASATCRGEIVSVFDGGLMAAAQKIMICLMASLAPARAEIEDGVVAKADQNSSLLPLLLFFQKGMKLS